MRYELSVRSYKLKRKFASTFQKLFILLLLSSFLLMSCGSINVKKFEARQDLFSKNIEGKKIIGHFKERVGYWYALLTLVQLNDPDIEKILTEKIILNSADGICNLKINDRFLGSDFFIGLLFGSPGFLIGYHYNIEKAILYSFVTTSIISTRTLVIEGDLYKNEKL
ncbi:MAG: hypothetical protein NT007_15100 [Candidatus Kapabacteria bacterium]|nr:hypothetical protein [Candidatus Kapabacteria bacterium]